LLGVDQGDPESRRAERSRAGTGVRCLSRRVVAYRIEARLDPARKTVTGSETVTYRNDSTETLKEIPFHLYPNAFSGDRTLFARETLQEEGPHPRWKRRSGRRDGDG